MDKREKVIIAIVIVVILVAIFIFGLIKLSGTVMISTSNKDIIDNVKENELANIKVNVIAMYNMLKMENSLDPNGGKNITLKDLAKEVGMSEEEISKYFRIRNNLLQEKVNGEWEYVK